jgi:SlyX protein
MDTHDLNRVITRLDDLEVKSAFSEDLLERLNDVVVRQQQQIDRLLREVARLAEQGAAAEGAGPRNLRDELPPHY